MAKKNKVRLSVTVNPDVLAAFKANAEAWGYSTSKFVEFALSSYNEHCDAHKNVGTWKK